MQGEALIEKGVSGALARTRDFFYNGYLYIFI